MTEKKPMTNKQLLDEIAKRTGMTSYKAGKVAGALADIINENVIEGRDTKLAGVGTFGIRKVSQRKSKDVNTGEDIIIPQHDVARFTPTSRLKRSVKSR